MPEYIICLRVLNIEMSLGYICQILKKPLNKCLGFYGKILSPYSLFFSENLRGLNLSETKILLPSPGGYYNLERYNTTIAPILTNINVKIIHSNEWVLRKTENNDWYMDLFNFNKDMFGEFEHFNFYHYYGYKKR
jgi:hypothetical protein